MVKQLIFGCCVLVVFIGTTSGQGDEGRNHVPEYLVESRVEKLNLETPIPLDYNAHVQVYVDVYTINRPDHLAGILSRSELYFPLFEEYLDKYNLPLELKYLAVIESALNPQAKSSSGAYGLWQFLYQASRMFDLRVTSYIDERADPVKATDAACRYLKYLHANFGDWLLAIAAYNGGIGAVNEAIVKAGGEKDYWKLRPYLSDQVRGYVPAFVAVNYAMSHFDSYSIEPGQCEFSYDDLVITTVEGGVSFQQIEELTGISIEILRQFNPAFTMDFIPVQAEPVKIIIPEDKLIVFHQKQPYFKSEKNPPSNGHKVLGDTTGRKKMKHVVESGEFFHEIAMKYQCRVEDLMVWNGLENKNLYAGQPLIVWIPGTLMNHRVSVADIERNLEIHNYNVSRDTIKSDI